MAKVRPGPLVSKVAGSIGPVVYYSHLGKTVVRARVRPHQKLTAGRIASRNAIKTLMAFWRIHKTNRRTAWNSQASPAMHGVNLFVRDNRPYVPDLQYSWPPSPYSWSLPQFYRELSAGFWYLHATINWDNLPGMKSIHVGTVGSIMGDDGTSGVSYPATHLHSQMGPSGPSYVYVALSPTTPIGINPLARQVYRAAWNDLPIL